MAYYPTNEDIQALYFTEKIWYVRIVLLNEKFQQVYEMQHEFVSGSMSINTDSDIRRTFSMTLGVINKNVGIAEDKILWLNRFVKVYIGCKVPYWENPQWYDQGIYVMTDYNYNITSGTLQVNCSDLVCFLNGDVAGGLEGFENIIYEEEKLTIRQAIIDTITGLTPFQKYYVDDMPKLVPFDLEFGATDTVWSILTKLRDLYPGYEMFFDTDGTFVCKKINTLETDPIVLHDDLLQRLYTNETDNGVMSGVRNVVKVWGACLDTDYFTEECTYDANTNTYTAKFKDIALNEDDNSLPTSTKFAVKIPTVNTAKEPKITIYNNDKLVGTFEITNSLEQKIGTDVFIEGQSFVFRYRRKSMYVLGQYQIVAVNKLRNTEASEEQKALDIKNHGTENIVYTVIPDSPFAIEKIGERMISYQGGDYDDIQAIDDCKTRAIYETWLAAKIIYTVTLEMVYIPWLNGNEKISFRLAATDELKDWIVSGISVEHPSGVMTLTLTEFSPLYHWLDFDYPV